MKKIIRWAIAGLVVVSSAGRGNDVEGVYTVIIKKQQEKKSTRWTLSDWLATKKRMALMDQWLALNTKTTLFEARLGGSMGDVEETTAESPISKKQTSRYQAQLNKNSIGLIG